MADYIYIAGGSLSIERVLFANFTCWTPQLCKTSLVYYHCYKRVSGIALTVFVLIDLRRNGFDIKTYDYSLKPLYVIGSVW